MIDPGLRDRRSRKWKRWERGAPMELWQMDRSEIACESGFEEPIHDLSGRIGETGMRHLFDISLDYVSASARSLKIMNPVSRASAHLVNTRSVGEYQQRPAFKTVLAATMVATGKLRGRYVSGVGNIPRDEPANTSTTDH